MERAIAWLFPSFRLARHMGAAIRRSARDAKEASGKEAMPRTPETEERKAAIEAPVRTEPLPEPVRNVAPQDALLSPFALERRAGWRVSRRASRPINLERRARFASVETL